MIEFRIEWRAHINNNFKSTSRPTYVVESHWHATSHLFAFQLPCRNRVTTAVAVVVATRNTRRKPADSRQPAYRSDAGYVINERFKEATTSNPGIGNCATVLKIGIAYQLALSYFAVLQTANMICDPKDNIHVKLVVELPFSPTRLMAYHMLRSDDTLCIFSASNRVGFDGFSIWGTNGRIQLKYLSRQRLRRIA